MGMTYEDANTYAECIDVLKAQDWLMDIKISCFHLWNEKDRSKFRESLNKIAYKHRKEKELSFKQFALETGMLNGK